MHAKSIHYHKHKLFYLNSCMFPWVKQGHKFQVLSFHFILFHYFPWLALSLGLVHHVHPFLFVNVSGIGPLSNPYSP